MDMIIIQYGRATQPRDWHVTEKRPPQFVRIYCMEGGNVQYRDTETSFPLRSKHLYLFPAQQSYSMTQAPEDPISCMWVHADISPFVLYHPIEIDTTQNPDILATLNLMRNQLERADGDDSCFADFAQALLKLFVRDGYLRQKIDRALLDILQFSSSATIHELSSRAGYSTEHFIRLFSASAGVTPYQYILNQRMNEAVALMSKGIKLEEVAQKVGYSSAKAFSCAFRRRYGIPPQTYRSIRLKRA